MGDFRTYISYICACTVVEMKVRDGLVDGSSSRAPKSKIEVLLHT